MTRMLLVYNYYIIFLILEDSPTGFLPGFKRLPYYISGLKSSRTHKATSPHEQECVW